VPDLDIGLEIADDFNGPLGHFGLYEQHWLADLSARLPVRIDLRFYDPADEDGCIAIAIRGTGVKIFSRDQNRIAPTREG